MKRIYLDYAATTSVDEKVFKAMEPFFSKKYGNASSLHSFGQEAQEAMEHSRKMISGYLGAESKEIIFTGSATESNNTALKGVMSANKKKGKHLIVSAIEHDCILNSAKWLDKQGYDVTWLKVDKDGMVDPKDVLDSIKKDTVLVSVMHANNEIGTVQPIAQIGKICREKGVYFHTDAAQSFGKIPINVNEMNIDLLTASSHKMYGPKGAALLYVRTGTNIEPLLHGGGHESGKRSSTENIPAIVGFAKAVQLCMDEMTTESRRQTELRDRVIRDVLENIPHSRLNGHLQKRLANNINMSFSFVEGESIIMRLDDMGIAVSTGSACSSPKLEPSHVIMAMGIEPQYAHGSVRISLGRFTTDADIDYLEKTLIKVIEDLRKISPFR